jgi:hypothetical protein
MATDDRFALLYNKKLLPLDQMGPKFLDYLVGQIRQYGQDTFPSDAALTAIIPVTAALTANKVDVAKLVALAAVTGTGRRLKASANDSRLQGIKIPPNAGVVYHIGLEQSDVEDGIETNPRTGAFQYVSILESLGRTGSPTSVTDNGNGTLTVNVNSLFESGDDHSGRQVRIWLKSAENLGPGPKSASAAVAIQTITVTFSTPNNTILVPNLMGQSAASVTASDYRVQAIGPTVKRLSTEDLTSTPGCFFLGAVTSVAAASLITVIDTSAQNLVSIGLADVDQRITDLETEQDALMRSCVLSGFANSGNSGLTFPVAGGTALIAGRRVTALAASITLLDNSVFNRVYLDAADNTIKLGNGTPGSNINNIWLYSVTTSAGAITRVDDIRRFASRNNSRDIITVGATNSDFTTLEGALDWCHFHRQTVGGTAEAIALEIVIQNNITMTRQALLGAPYIIRGAAVDGTSIGVGSPRVKIITPSGLASAFSVGFSPLANVVFRDLYFSVPTAAGSGFFDSTAGSAELGENWLFQNCVFDGGRDTPMFKFNRNLSHAGWRWTDCVFRNAAHTAANPYFLITTTSNSPPLGFVWDNCRFFGGTGDALTQGISFDGNVTTMVPMRCRVSGCEFTMGGFSIMARNLADQVRINDCKFLASLGDCVSLASDGEVAIDNCFFNGCVSSGTGSIIAVSTISSHGGGNTIIKGNRFQFTGAGEVIKVGVGLAGSVHQINNNVATTNSGTGIFALVQANHCRIQDNDVDYKVVSQNGAASVVAVDARTGAGIFITGNRFRNVGTSGSPSAGCVRVGSDGIASRNMFFACAGVMVDASQASSHENIISENIIADTPSSGGPCIQVTSAPTNTIVKGNIIKNNGSNAALSINSAASNAIVEGNLCGVVPAQNSTTAPSLDRGFINRAIFVAVTYNPGSTLWPANSTVEGQVIADARSGLGGHIPFNAAIVQKHEIDAPGDPGIQVGIRIRWTDGTAADFFNTTTSTLDVDFLDPALSYVPPAASNSICYIAFVVKNTYLVDKTADLGSSKYLGIVTG